MTGMELPMYALMGLGTLTAAGQVMQGQEEAKQLKQQAAMTEAVSAQQAESQRRQARMALGSAAAQYGASGVDFQGSPVDMLAQSAAFGELDAQNLLYRGSVEAYGLRAKSKAAKKAGYIGAASTLATTFGAMYAGGAFDGTSSGITGGAGMGSGGGASGGRLLGTITPVG